MSDASTGRSRWRRRATRAEPIRAEPIHTDPIDLDPIDSGGQVGSAPPPVDQKPGAKGTNPSETRPRSPEPAAADAPDAPDAGEADAAPDADAPGADGHPLGGPAVEPPASGPGTRPSRSWGRGLLDTLNPARLPPGIGGRLDPPTGQPSRRGSGS
ncbi:MAG: hypothetical protein ACQSGP_14080 [Frankia sp.]